MTKQMGAKKRSAADYLMNTDDSICEDELSGLKTCHVSHPDHWNPFFSLLRRSACLSHAALTAIPGTRGPGRAPRVGTQSRRWGAAWMLGDTSSCHGHFQLLAPPGLLAAAVRGCMFSFGNVGIQNRRDLVSLIHAKVGMSSTGTLPLRALHLL